jgi:hypothetical protein
VTLHANTTYYLATSETAGGDSWYDYDTHLVTTNVAADVGATYAFASAPSAWHSGGTAGNGWGPVTLRYS